MTMILILLTGSIDFTDRILSIHSFMTTRASAIIPVIPVITGDMIPGTGDGVIHTVTTVAIIHHSPSEWDSEAIGEAVTVAIITVTTMASMVVTMVVTTVLL